MVDLATIRTAIQIYDGMSPAFRSMNNAMNIVLNSFESLQRASGNTIDTGSIQTARQELVRAETAFNRIEQEIREADRQQQILNNNIRGGTSAANGLLTKLGAIVATYLGIHTSGNIIKLSDEATNTTARLNLLLDENSTQQELDNLQNMIFDSAQRSYSSYLDTAAVVSKLGILAGKAFTGNDEIIAFTELMNKNFAIGGQGIQEQTAAMYQLTQAMAAGKLQGDEFRSITENAPLLAQAIEEQMRKIDPKGSMKEWSAEGLLTADIIKSAMFSAADEINEKFNSMPLTFSQLWENFKSDSFLAFQPVLQKINEIANNDKFHGAINGIVNSFYTLSNVVLSTLSVFMSIGGFIYDNWSIIGPVIMGLATTLGIYTGVLIAHKVALMGVAAWNSILALRTAGQAAATTMAAGATFMQTAAQYGLNAALYACPITWIILGIIAVISVIYLAVAAINKFAGTSYSATGIISGAFAVMGAFIANVFMGLLEIIFGVIEFLYNNWVTFANFLGNVFNDPVASIIHLFGDLADNVLGVIEKIAKALDFVFGSNLASTVSGWRSTLSEMTNWAAEKYGNGTYEVLYDKLDMDSVLADLGVKLDRFEYSNAWDTGYDWGKGVEDKISGAFKMDDLLGNAGVLDNFPVADALDKIGDKGSDTAGNTKKMADSMEASEEDLKYLRDLAEQEVINRFTTAEIKVDFSSQNTINSELDLDGIIDKFTEKLEEAIDIAAEGE
ncbi:tape measure protein [Cytobacillus massiliigabonensis]|uniref:tape measure protein n=1 Tax=Cytobacillus massiliigabonensis TaxID=1871011 RepID=UPI000C820B25|nr:tape measure protein [Cytobacillus massiliigabonensis]